MAILPGLRLGPYEILSAIGAGGMSGVYKARDDRLYRIVAIKVLPSHLADSPELRERFEREARTIASLNHPHICTLYDVGHQDGTDYLVMEYLDIGWRITRPSRADTKSISKVSRSAKASGRFQSTGGFTSDGLAMERNFSILRSMEN